jgi:hypothetical protein
LAQSQISGKAGATTLSVTEISRGPRRDVSGMRLWLSGTLLNIAHLPGIFLGQINEVFRMEQQYQPALCTLTESSQMMRFQLVRNYRFIFENNDGSGREELGQIELPDDDEAFAFGEQVIREMMQGSGRQYGGCAIELYESGRIVGRIPLENYQKPLSPWHLGVATQ